MTRLRNLALTLAAALTGACSTMAPDYQRPVAPVPATFPGEVPTEASAVAPLADTIAWGDYFADERLRELIGLALDNNRDLRVAALNIERARAQYRIQRADLYPAVGAGGGQSAQRLPADLSPTGESTVNRQYSATLGVSAWELDFFGRIRSLNEQALQLYLGTEEARRAAQVSLVAEVANAWLTLAADRERMALAQNTYDTRRKSYELIGRSFEAGAVSALDLRQAETQMESARGDVALFAALVAQDENALALLAGMPVPERLLPAKLTDSLTAVQALPAGVPSEVLMRRPDILQAERQLRAANASIGAARAAFFPAITLTGAAGTASAALDGLFDGGSGTWSFMPQIRLPIFEAGRLHASLDVAEIQREVNVAEYEKSIQSAFREVADALADRATLAERLDARQRMMAASRETYRLSDARYKGGIDSFLAVLDAQRTLYAAEQELIAVRLADAANRVALYRALGGGWQ
ncbi:AdeC/AdeK/OprM family multidrug efflux complex outer membrane factor [Thauera phenolivorans]|uniref:AdeC/AdeK/OprM family multidrug efflux complex outer membrane factor n=1 Tax=Thauera phenolivorans TaxID=1792543 RepID=UPI00083B7F18|nr:AdeC/AdeK/OprM family multidrug efflux complex outer membrane factor [Thauera phenolivorans]